MKQLFKASLLLISAMYFQGCDSSNNPTIDPELTPPVITPPKSDNLFAGRENGNLILEGKKYQFQGTNNYYMHYKSDAMIDDVLINAVAMNIDVIRIWGYLDGENDHNVDMQPKLGVYTPREGMGDGWERLDYTIKKAGELGIKLVIAMTNNWDDFGGIPQYVKWLNLNHHDDFYTDESAKTAYKNYVNHLINRVNTYTNVAYKNDPVIMTWELINEPRAESDSTKKILTTWADEMSTYVKSLDENHLVALGSEGFFNRDHTNWAYNGTSGVDWEAILALPNIDYGTVHLYPEHWGLEDQVEPWGKQWIIDHIEAGKKIGKPVVLEEYGVTAGGSENRAFVYESWTNAVYDNEGAGSMFWILSGIDDGSNADAAGLYPDYDGFRVINDDSDSSKVLVTHGAMMQGGADTRTNKVYLTAPANNTNLSGTVKIMAYPFVYQNSLTAITMKTSTGQNLSMTDEDGDGYYTATWDTSAEVENSQITITINATIGEETFSQSITVTIDNDFNWVEGEAFEFINTDSLWLADGAWQATWADPEISHSATVGEGALAINGTFTGENDWEELRIKVPTINSLSQYQRVKYDIYYPASVFDDASDAAQAIRPYAVLNPGWQKIGVDKVIGSISDYPIVTFNNNDYYHVHVDTTWDPKLDANEFYIGLVNNELAYKSSTYIDNVRFYQKQ